VGNRLSKSMMVISIIIFPALFSCATTQQKAAAYNSRGITYVAKGQYDQAISDFNKAIEIDSRIAAFYFNRGIVYLKKGQFDEAISDFSKTIEIDPRDGEAYYNRGRSHYLKKEYDKSWKDIKRTQDLGYKISPEFLDDLRKASGREK
jgi:tetratricopeptide (TPR) repeat protein